jgi:protein-arginine kinase
MSQKIDKNELTEAVQQLTSTIKKRTSYSYRVISGLLTGVATAIGATVIAGLVVYIASQAIQQLNLSSVPQLQPLFESADLLSGTVQE